MAGQFDFQSHPEIAAAYQRQQEIALAQQRQADQAQKERVDMVTQTAQGASALVQSFVDAAQKRQQANAVKALTNLVGQGAMPVSKEVPPAVGIGPSNQATVPYSSTPQYKSKQMALLMTANPQKFMEQQNKQVFAEPKSVDQLAAESIQRGQPVPPEIQDFYAMRAGTKKSGGFQSKNILFNDVPMEANYKSENGKYYDIQTGEELKGKIQPYGVTSATAEIRKDALINTMNQQLSTAMQPSKWAPGTLAGKSANIVANADSAINLADQILQGKVPATDQTMTTLAQDVNRVITQSGQTSEKITEELRSRTGYSKLADAIQFFTNHPQDQKAGAFVQVLKNEVTRQREQRQSIVDRTLKSSLPALNQLKKMDPESWAMQLDAAGIDPEEAKKGRFKFKPGVISSIYGENPSGGAQSNATGGKLTPEQEAAQFLQGL